MRQIRPRTRQPDTLPGPLPIATVEPTGLTVDLRDHQTRHPSYTDEVGIRQQLAVVRTAIAAVMDQLSHLVDERENLKARLGSFAATHPASAPFGEDHSVVAWGFFDDDL